jgi:hypothetical protein
VGGELFFFETLSKMTFSISYIFELRNLAVNKRLLAKGTILRMKRSNMLLGSRRVKRSGVRSNEGDEDDWDLQDDLLLPNKVAIADDTNAYQLFGDRVFCAPQEDILEGILLESFCLFSQSLIYHQSYTSSWAPPA